ncbi:MAG: GNAT family N-acetyltransferase [Actinomycetota bacterium]
MTASLRRAKPEDLEQLVAMDLRNFGVTILPADAEIADDLLDPDRFVVAFDGDQMVGAGGSYQMDLTVPGGGTLPLSGVTWVSVLASHRRQGLLRSIMNGLDELAVELEEPVLGLTASEGPIYERFGYGIATRTRVTTVDRRRTGIRPDLEPERVRLVEAEEHVDELLAIYDRYRLTQVGEVSRSEPVMREQTISAKKRNFAAIHPDGYAVWSVDLAWHDGHPAHTVWIKDLVAVTPEAHVALWHLLLSLDLVGSINGRTAVAPDDLLPSILTDQRALRTTDLNDGLWLKVADPIAAFSARDYRTDDRLVVGVTDDLRIGRAASPPVTDRFVVTGAGAGPTDEEPDIVLTRAGLGPLLLGTSATVLTDGGMAIGDDKALNRADLFFGQARAAHCRTGF